MDCAFTTYEENPVLKHYAFVLASLVLVSYITFNLANTAKYTDSTFQRVESVVSIIKQK